MRVGTAPISIFRHRGVFGNRKDYREFCGCGVPTHCTIISTQRENKTVVTSQI